MKKIYLLQMHTRTIPSRIIKLLTGYKYSHIGLSFSKKCDVIYSFGRRKYNSILNSGFVELRREDLFFKKFNQTECRIYELTITNRQYKKLKKVINYLLKNSDEYKYDYFGLVLRYFKMPVRFSHKYVCSFFIAELLEDANICKFNKNSCFVEPKDFEKIKNVNIIYQGKYLSY